MRSWRPFSDPDTQLATLGGGIQNYVLQKLQFLLPVLLVLELSVQGPQPAGQREIDRETEE